MTVADILSTVSNNYEQYISQADHGPLVEIIQSGGVGGTSGNISHEDYEFLLLFDDEIPIFHELPYRVLFNLAGLMTRLGRVQVTQDHYHFWGWTAEVLRSINRDKTYVDKDIERMFLLAVDFAISSPGSVPVSERLWEDNRQIHEVISPHSFRALASSHRAATQLSYPLIEGFLRRLCSAYVKIDGQIKSGKKILGTNGSERSTGRVNNVGDLLYHFEKRVADRESVASLRTIRSEMNKYSTSHTGYGIINSWRHPHSHGGEKFTGTEHVVLLNIVSQLIWGEIPKQEYDHVDKSRYTEKIFDTSQYGQSHAVSHDYYPLRETRDLLTERGWTPDI